MFTLPQPQLESSSDKGVDCPLVVLQDSPEDVEVLLAILYDTFRYDGVKELTMFMDLSETVFINAIFNSKFPSM